MNSQIDPQLTPQEKAALELYRDPNRGLRRAAMLSLAYGAGAGVFTVLAIWDGEPLYVLAVYGVLLVVMCLRLWRGRKLANVMPSIIDKYEAIIAELKATARR